MTADNFTDFSRKLLGQIAANLDLPYEALAADFAAVQATVDAEAEAKNVAGRDPGLEIVSWHGEGDVDLDDPLVRGGVGGIWRDDPPWDEYLATWLDPMDRARLTKLKVHLVETGNKRGGYWHQREGIPRFSDGSYLYLSMRAWGDLQAAVWGGHYCRYAWED